MYFNTRTTNAILYQSSTGQFVNTPYLTNQGYELSQKANIYGVNLSAAYTIQNPIQASTGQIPQLIAKQFGSIDINKPFGIYDVGTKVVFSGTRQSTLVEPNNSYSSVPVTLNAYQVWSFYAGMKDSDEWTARVRLNNAFNEQYQLVGGYNTAGRNVMFTMTYQQK
jgi:vitamin B12 transporter